MIFTFLVKSCISKKWILFSAQKQNHFYIENFPCGNDSVFMQRKYSNITRGFINYLVLKLNNIFKGRLLL